MLASMTPTSTPSGSGKPLTKLSGRIASWSIAGKQQRSAGPQNDASRAPLLGGANITKRPNFAGPPRIAPA